MQGRWVRGFCFTLLALLATSALAEFSGPFPQNPVQFIQATGNSSNRDVQINAALVAYGRVQLGCGMFWIGASILMPSNSDLGGSGPCTIVNASPTMIASPLWPISGGSSDVRLMVTNATYTGGGTSNGHMHDLTLQIPANPGRIYPSAFYNVTNWSVDHMNFIGDSTGNSFDGITFLASNHYTVSHSTATGLTNSCYDNWAGDYSFQYTDNICLGAGFTSFGILINGLTTAYAAATTYDGVVSNNRVYNVRTIGIQAEGLYNAGTAAYGAVSNVVIANNVIDTVTQQHCIQAGDGINITVVGNYIRNCYNSGIYAASSGPAGTLVGITITGNTIDTVNVGGTTQSAIIVGTGSSNATETGNTIVGTTHWHGISIAAGVTGNVVGPNSIVVGAGGDYVFDASGGQSQYFDGSYYEFNGGTGNGVSFGANGGTGTIRVDLGGNLLGTTRDLGSTASSWRNAYVAALQGGGSVPTASGSCAVNNQRGNNRVGSFTLNGACAAGTIILTFANASQYDNQCPPIVDSTTKIAYPQSNAASTTTATFTVTGANGDLFRFGPCVGFSP